MACHVGLMIGYGIQHVEILLGYGICPQSSGSLGPLGARYML